MKELDIAKIFGSKCRAKLLEKFFLEYESGNNDGLHMRALSRELDEQINSIKRELDNLTDLGILKHRTELKKKIFFVNTKFYLIDEFIKIFLKTYNPIDKVKEYFKPKIGLELVIVNNSIKTKLTKVTNNTDIVLDIFLIGEVDKEHLSDFLYKTFYGRKIKYAAISTENFYERLEFGDALVKKILTQEGNLYLRDTLKIKEKLGNI